MIKHSQKFFWFALLGHILFFLLFTLVILEKPYTERQPYVYMPAYVSQELIKTTSSTSSSSSAKAKKTPTKSKSKGDLALSKQEKEEKEEKEEKMEPQKAASELSKNNKSQRARNYTARMQPQNLLPDQKIDKPLLKLLSRATSAHLVYPKIAIDFKLKGISHIGFVISPNGYVTNVTLLKTSGSDVLDNAALSAVNAMSPVKNVDLYLKQPKKLVVGIIFG